MGAAHDMLVADYGADPSPPTEAYARSAAQLRREFPEGSSGRLHHVRPSLRPALAPALSPSSPLMILNALYHGAEQFASTFCRGSTPAPRQRGRCPLWTLLPKGLRSATSIVALSLSLDCSFRLIRSARCFRHWRRSHRSPSGLPFGVGGALGGLRAGVTARGLRPISFGRAATRGMQVRLRRGAKKEQPFG